MKLFISYSSRDKAGVKTLAEDLKKAVKVLSRTEGGDVWFDQELIGGHDWWENILSKIRACDVFIFVITQESLKSDPCKLEYGYAHSLHKRILPILLGDGVNVTILPEPLQRVQFVDYRKRDVEAFQRLSEAMAGLPPAVPLPHPLPEPPAAPISPMAQFKQQLEAPTLSFETQTSLLYQLKQYLTDPEHAETARFLIMELRKHPDTRASIAEEVAKVLKDTPPPMQRPPAMTGEAGASSGVAQSFGNLMNRFSESLQKPAAAPPAAPPVAQSPPQQGQYGAPQPPTYGQAGYAAPYPQQKRKSDNWWNRQTQSTQIIIILLVLGALASCMCYCILAVLSSSTPTY